MLDSSRSQSRAIEGRGRSAFHRLLLLISLTALLGCAHSGIAGADAPVPVAAYSFDEGSGAVVKDSAGKHDGTISGATWTATGKYGSALDFDGLDDLVSVANAASLDLTGSFTLEAWVQPRSLTTSRPVIGKQESTGGISGYLLAAKYGDGPTGFVGSSGTLKSVTRPSALPTGGWSHLAFTSDGSTLRLYVDGEFEAEAPAIAAKATAANLLIGHSPTLGYFDGMIDEVRLYGEALSESQVKADRDTAVGLDQIPVAAYSFDEGSGSTAADSAGNHDGTIAKATWTTGKYGSALNFNGADALVSVANAADLDLTGAFTLEAWVRPGSLSAARPVISKGETSKGASGYLLSAKHTANSAGYVASSGSAAEVAGPALPTNAWSHLTLTFDGANLRLYVDGKLAATKTGVAIAVKATSAPLEIGHSAFGGYFEGRIDEVRIYNETLTEGQIQVDRDNRVEAPAPTEVITTMLDTGPSAELVSSVPITSTGVETVVYSLPIPSIKAGEVMRASGNIKLVNTHTYDITDSVRLVLGTSPSDSTGTATFTPWTRVRQTWDMEDWTLPINGAYRARSELGDLYVNLVVKTASSSAQANDELMVYPNGGRLSVTRYTPAVGPMSQATHQLQPLTDIPSLQLSSLPVDSVWRTVISRRATRLSVGDILDIAAQIGVENTSGTSVQLESKLIFSATHTGTSGSPASGSTIDRLLSTMSLARLVHSNALMIGDPSKPYVNLVVRALPVGSSPQPLTISAGSATLDILRFTPSPGEPTALLRKGTWEHEPASVSSPEVTSIPFASGSTPEKRVVASRAIYGPRKGDVIRGRGLMTGDLLGGKGSRIWTELVVANSPTETTGEILAKATGDSVSTAEQIHTVVKEGTYVVPKAFPETRYLNLVAYATRAPTYAGESMKVSNAWLSYSRSMPTAPLNEGFENGLDALFKYEWNGTLSASSAVAREGNKSMLVNLDLSTEFPDGRPASHRLEVRPPDLRASGGYAGGESWYGMSVLFPEGFDPAPPDPYRRFTGVIDEVRLHDEPLSESDIESDLAGSYSQTPVPVAAYSFNEGSGSIAIDSAGVHDGMIAGATWTSGKFGAALDFDGLHDLVTVADDASLDFSDAFTLEAWVRPAALASTTPILAKADSDIDGESGYALNAQSFGGPAGRIYNDGDITHASGSEALPVDTWSHLALTFNGTSLRVYVDGDLVAAKESAINPAPSEAALTIGGSPLSPTQIGEWNVFTQWRHPGFDGIDGCPMEPHGRPSVILSARHYKAGAHTNPGDTSTATPTEGDYLDVRFYGGKLNSDCQYPVAAPEIYVLAPLERGRWYDFVQHTRWTALEGSPGNSVTELWIDGEQILGDQTTPVSTPSLFWHEAVDNYNFFTYPQLGLYTSETLDERHKQLYIDAVRSGNSYGEVAPGE